MGNNGAADERSGAGGLIGIIGIGIWVSLASLVIVGGAVGRFVEGGRVIRGVDGLPMPASFRWALVEGIGGSVGGTLLVLFGLASLGAACYLIDTYSERMNAHWPLRRRWIWGWIGGIAALGLITIEWSRSIGRIENLMAMLFSPVLGAMAADMVLQRGGWGGVRPGLNPAGLLAIGVGVLTRPALAMMVSWNHGAEGFVPMAIWQFMAAALVYGLSRAVGLVPAAIAVGTYVPSGVETKN